MIGKLTARLNVFLLLAVLIILAGCGGGGGDAGEDPSMNSTVSSGKSSVVPVADPVPSGDSSYSLRILEIPGRSCYAVDVNEFGEVAGNIQDEKGDLHAFYWRDGQMEILAESAQASAINRQGTVVGWLETAEGPEAFVHDGALLLLGSEGGVSRAMDVNDLEQVVGRRSAGSERAFIETGMEQLEFEGIEGYALAINNPGHVVIKEIRNNSFGALLWDGESFIDLGSLGGLSTQARDLNDRGQVVGWSETARGEYHAFLWEEGQILDLTPPGYAFSSAVAINERGQVLIKASSPQEDASFLWKDGEWTDLGNFGIEWLTVSNLNDRGQIVGWLADSNGAIHGFLATPED